MLVLKKVDSEEEIRDVYRLRYKVYCQEKMFEEARCFPDGQEIDEYDPYSVHFIARIDDETVGTSRLILNNPLGYPIEKSCELNISYQEIMNEHIAEVSRLAISKDIVKAKGCDRRGIVLGLIKEMIKESKNVGVTFVYAAMSKSLHKLLEKCGIRFFQAGPVVDYHGLRAPYFSRRQYIEDNLIVNDLNTENMKNIGHTLPHVSSSVK